MIYLTYGESIQVKLEWNYQKQVVFDIFSPEMVIVARHVSVSWSRTTDEMFAGLQRQSLGYWRIHSLRPLWSIVSEMTRESISICMMCATRGFFFWRRQVHSHWRQIWVTCGYQYDLRDRQIQSEHFRIVRLSLQTKIRREEEEKQPNEREEQAVWGRKALLRPERPYSLKHRSISS